MFTVTPASAASLNTLVDTLLRMSHADIRGTSNVALMALRQRF